MKRRKVKKDAGFIFSSIILLIALLLVAIGPSEASDAKKTVTKGYYGSERIHVVEKPVKANSQSGQVTTQKGYIGGKRIDLRVVRKNEYTKTRGWVDGKYVRTKEEKK